MLLQNYQPTFYKSLNLYKQCQRTHWMDVIHPNLQKFMSLQMVPCNDNFFSRQAARFSAENFVLSGHQAALTYSLLYFCLEICHRMIQCSSLLLTQRQWAIRITFVSDWLLIPTRWLSGRLSNGPAICYLKSISTKPFVWSPIFRLLNYCLATICTHVDYWLPSSKCSECWHMLLSLSVL